MKFIMIAYLILFCCSFIGVCLDNETDRSNVTVVNTQKDTDTHSPKSAQNRPILANFSNDTCAIDDNVNYSLSQFVDTLWSIAMYIKWILKKISQAAAIPAAI